MKNAEKRPKNRKKMPKKTDMVPKNRVKGEMKRVEKMIY